MICYSDKTFCPFWEECKDGNTCHRALTEEVIQRAIEWWGDDSAPICQHMNKPECFEEN